MNSRPSRLRVNLFGFEQPIMVQSDAKRRRERKRETAIGGALEPTSSECPTDHLRRCDMDVIDRAVSDRMKHDFHRSIYRRHSEQEHPAGSKHTTYFTQRTFVLVQMLKNRETD